MISDESSSDSETGRFKCSTEKHDEKTKHAYKHGDSLRSAGRSSRPSGDRFARDSDRRKSERDHYRRHPRDRHFRLSPEPRHSRLSNRRRYSTDKSSSRRSPERHIPRRNSRDKSKPRDYRSSKERRRHSRSQSYKSPGRKLDLKEEIRKIVVPKEKSLDKFNRKSKDKSSSPDFQGKRSVVHKPLPIQMQRKRSISPINVDQPEELIQSGSYYNMIPAVVKEKSDESSETDSSDDERLRAKLLNLEKELHKTKKKKHKKKHKKKNNNSEMNKEHETPVEVTSTTDIENKSNVESFSIQADTTEVTSTQKVPQKESSEEGEISSENDSQVDTDIDPSDLRHKLKRSCPKEDQTGSPDLRHRLKNKNDMSGPVLSPNLDKHHRSVSPSVEGPALPPHLQKKTKHIGPSIPSEMRKVLAESECNVIHYKSSDEDIAIGPLPVGKEEKWSDAHKRLEERALDLKIKKLDGLTYHKSDIKSREQWMLELPEAKAKHLGLEARTFRAKEGPDMSDRSSWTDTPEQKARKAAGLSVEVDAGAALEQEAHARRISARDQQQEQAIKKHKKKHKREESLLAMHQKKLKKKKKKEERDEGKKERRPFSRDVDLQVNRFDDAQKKSIIKKAQHLDTRFSSGEAKYL